MKKNQRFEWEQEVPIVKNLLRIMKLTVILLLASVLGVLANKSYSQTMDLKLENTTLKEVLSKIEGFGECYFLYSEKFIDVQRKVSVNFENTEIDDALITLFADTEIEFERKGRIIILSQNTEFSSQQQKDISGRVTDASGERLPGVTVFVKGTTQGAVTNFDGNYSISNVPATGTLVFSFVGMRSQEVGVGNQSTINVQMAEDAIGIEEVVAIGYGTQKKVNLTGAVAALKMDEVLGDRPVTSLGAILQGTVPGFTASSSVVPGGGNSFNIRGFESINGGAPLVLVDNVVFNSLSLINPEDIESVSVLKDASSAAIYGARASFGVILITTKKGKRNKKSSINYNNSFAMSMVDRLPELASPTDMIRTLQDGGYSSIWSGQNIEVYGNLLQEYKNNPSAYPLGWIEDSGTKYFLKETDLMGDMFESSFKQTHNISVQGGSEDINYRISMGYTDENGILVTDKDAFKRTNVSSYVNGDITSWLSASLDVKYAKGDKRYPYSDAPLGATLWRSNLPSYHPDDVLPYGTDGPDYLVFTPANIIEQTNVSTTITDNTRIFSSAEIKPFEGFKGILEYSYQLTSIDYQAYANYFQVHQGLTEGIKSSTVTNPFSTSRASTRYTTINAYTNYDKTISEKHNISVVVGYNQEYSDYRYLYSSAYNMISNELPSLNGTDGSTPPETGDSYNEFALRSGFFRTNYNYAQKYFIEFNGRYDLSSKFPKDYRAGFFPSVSAAWNISKESFMDDTHKAVSLMKLRGSYGTLGNQSIENYGFLPTLPVVNGHWINNGLVPQTLGNLPMVRANYTWESVNTINGGIDFGFLRSKLTGSFDIFSRNTIGMLGPGEEFPAVAGASAPNQNAADLKTNGWEFAVSWKGNAGEVKYGFGFNIYDSRSEITKYKNETKLLSAPYYVGQEIGEIWGYVADGFYTESDFDETDALNEGVVRIQGVTSHVGDIKFKNLSDNERSTNIIDNGDNTVNDPGDRTVIGNRLPRYQFGFNGNAEWNGFGLSFILQGVAKRDAWIGGNIIFPMADQFGTVYDHQVGKIWTAENSQNAYYGRIYENAGSSQSSNQRVSDKFLSDASYLRVKNITLSYNLPGIVLQRVNLKNMKLFISGENLFTLDHLASGIDPENLGWTYPHYSTISVGINLNL